MRGPELHLYDSSLNVQVSNIANYGSVTVNISLLPSELSAFVPGDELVFAIEVLFTGDIFFMGPASRNPDNVVHATANALASGDVEIAFEDFFGGGDLDYDDARFAITSGASIPEPATGVLLGLGLAGIAIGRRRRPC